VESASVGCPLRAEEPDEIANAAAELGLAYIVLTSVDRDDLPDRGAGHFAACIRAIRSRLPDSGVEVLVPDYTGLEMATVVAAGPRVVAHNVETVRRLQGVRDARASFDGSLATLGSAKKAGATTKTSILLGLGETESEVLVALDEIRGVGVDILVLGQYLRPTLRHVPITEYVPPAQFDAYATEARSRGFSTVVSAPFARTSYHAREASVGVVAVKE
jgi:lipoic acid synthetase